MNLYDEFLEFEKTDEFQLDPWQKEVMEHKGNSSIRTGRQSGKSEVVGRKSTKVSIKYTGTITLIIAASQRQSGFLYVKVMARLESFNRWLVAKNSNFREDPTKSNRQNLIARRENDNLHGIFDGLPTKTEIRLRHDENIGKPERDRNKDLKGSIIYAFPAGKTGAFIRGLTIDHMVADEAAFIPEPVWLAIMPMIAVSRKLRGMGWITLLSTPFGKGGYFYESQTDDTFKHWHVSSENCPRIPRDFLQREKERLSKAEYAQEYLGEFVDEFNQLFPTELIKKCMTFYNWDIIKDRNANASYYLGIDPARYGQDEAAFVSGELLHKKFKIVHCDEKKKKPGKTITSLRDFTIILDEKFKYKRIFNDDTGVGGGLTDLLQEDLGKSKVIGLNNASKRIRVGTEERKKGILKEDLYSNALSMMERGDIQIINNLKLLRSLKSVQFEYTKDRNLRIHGRYTHLAEAFVRCCWAWQSKGHKLYCA